VLYGRLHAAAQLREQRETTRKQGMERGAKSWGGGGWFVGGVGVSHGGRWEFVGGGGGGCKGGSGGGVWGSSWEGWVSSWWGGCLTCNGVFVFGGVVAGTRNEKVGEGEKTKNNVVGCGGKEGGLGCICGGVVGATWTKGCGGVGGEVF